MVNLYQVHPNVPCMLFTPICPHSLSFRPVILPDSSQLELKVIFYSHFILSKVRLTLSCQVIEILSSLQIAPEVLPHLQVAPDFWNWIVQTKIKARLK